MKPNFKAGRNGSLPRTLPFRFCYWNAARGHNHHPKFVPPNPPAPLAPAPELAKRLSQLGKIGPEATPPATP